MNLSNKMVLGVAITLISVSWERTNAAEGAQSSTGAILHNFDYCQAFAEKETDISNYFSISKQGRELITTEDFAQKPGYASPKIERSGGDESFPVKKITIEYTKEAEKIKNSMSITNTGKSVEFVRKTHNGDRKSFDTTREVSFRLIEGGLPGCVPYSDFTKIYNQNGELVATSYHYHFEICKQFDILSSKNSPPLPAQSKTTDTRTPSTATMSGADKERLAKIVKSYLGQTEKVRIYRRKNDDLEYIPRGNNENSYAVAKALHENCKENFIWFQSLLSQPTNLLPRSGPQSTRSQ